ncbi:MAG: YHS domain-containing protein [Sulfolobales archaeon]|nr:YHS domain-containing protein [Sulfolobales archaeon]MCX8208462.1 YHS domain-containing protein [Sulfolobales archaeon]MDW8010113.1 YHS domain-containing protein [Sulfolobales archaeon]
MEVVVDPVCGMKLDPAKAKYKSVYKGKVYYFCCARCQKAFEENPEYYLEHGPTGMPK